MSLELLDGDNCRKDEGMSKRLSSLSGMGDNPKTGGKKTRARAEDGRWTLEPHVCRHCFGRLVSAPAAVGGATYQCSNCGATATGAAPDVLCCCGMTLRRHGPGSGPISAGLRCQPNPSKTPEFPSLFVAGEPPT